MRHILLKTLCISGVIAISSCSQSTKIEETTMEQNLAIDKADMNLSVKPGENFYQYSNGGWIKNNPVPGDKTQYGSFTVLYDNNQNKLKDLITEVSKNENKKGTNAQKIADFYNSGMDTAKIEADGIKPIEPYLQAIDNIASTDDLIKQVAEMHKLGFNPLFYFSNIQDEKNSNNVISILYQGGISLPDRDYYLSEDEMSQNIRTKYIEYISNMFTLAGNSEKAKQYANIVFNIETKLAENAFTRLELRNPFENYNKLNLEGLKTMSPNVNWDLYYNTIGLTATGEINAAQKKFISGLSNLFNDVSIDDWKIYLKWKIINGASSYLTSDFEKESFAFYGGVLSGQKEMRPRWKRVLGTTDGALGEALGQLYVEKYFPPAAKERMIKLVDNLKTAFEGRIKNVDWMTDTTKQKAIEKLNAITVKVGYPDKWKDYSKLDITPNSYFGNVIATRKFNFEDGISKIGKPYDKAQWGMSPQTVNAYYSPNSNEIVFPAAILQPPFFYMDADDAVNYGGIGVVIGHEMTHGFDDQGRNYDKDGNLNNWWTETDSKAFDKRKQVVIDQFNNYTELDSLTVDGDLTIGENLADLGGLNISWDAFMTTEQGKTTDTIAGFNPQQRFILSYAKLWRQNILNEELMRRLKEDVHSPGDARVNVPLFNLDQVYDNFEISENDKLYRKKDDRARVW